MNYLKSFLHGLASIISFEKFSFRGFCKDIEFIDQVINVLMERPRLALKHNNHVSAVVMADKLYNLV